MCVSDAKINYKRMKIQPLLNKIYARLNNIYVRNLLVLILVIFLLISIVLLWLSFYTQHGKVVEVPNVKGLSVEKAEHLFAEKKLDWLVIDSVFIKNAVPGSIAETTPSIGSKVKRGRTIYLKLISYLPQLIAIPDVKYTSQRQSMAMLRSLGFENVVIRMVPGAYKELVLGLESRGTPMEAGRRMPADTPLSLLVSAGSDNNLFLDNPVVDSSNASIDDSEF